MNKKFSHFKVKQTEVAVIYHRLESSEVASKLTWQQKTLQCRQFDSLWISRAKTSSAVLIEPKFLREREGAAIHPILNSSSYVRHQTKHKRRLWCYLWIRNFHSLKVKQTGGEEAFWPPTHWWSVIKRFIYHSVPEKVPNLLIFHILQRHRQWCGSACSEFLTQEFLWQNQHLTWQLSKVFIRFFILVGIPGL